MVGGKMYFVRFKQRSRPRGIIMRDLKCPPRAEARRSQGGTPRGECGATSDVPALPTGAGARLRRPLWCHPRPVRRALRAAVRQRQQDAAGPRRSEGGDPRLGQLQLAGIGSPEDRRLLADLERGIAWATRLTPAQITLLITVSRRTDCRELFDWLID